jgi:ribosomal protein L32
MYVEVAIGSPRKRGLLIVKENLHDLFLKEGKEQAVYRSLYTYYDDAFEYVKAKGSLRDFQGERGIEEILIDIDKKDNSDIYTQQMAQNIVMAFSDMDVGEYSIQPYFSGTGYHIMVSGEVFNFKKGKNLPYIVKETLKSIFDDIDFSIYSRTGIYRLEHTLNPKKGFYKIPLSHKELFNLNIEEIKELAKDRRLVFQYNPLEGNGELQDKIIKFIPKVRSLQTVFEPKNVVPCIQKLYNQGPNKGNRNNTILRLASHYLRHGFPSEQAKAGILHWNNNSLDENIVLSNIENTYNRGYRYGCNDYILHEHCSPRCIHYKNKNYLVEVKTSDQMQKALEERMSANYEGKTLDLAKLYGIDDRDIMVYPGELMTIFGPTGASKTTLAQNIVLGYDAWNNYIRSEYQIPTLYLSLELTDWYTHKRHLQIVSGMSKKNIEKSYQQMYEHHKDDISHIVVNTVSPTVDGIREMIISYQPRCVVIDYIDLVQPPSHIRGEYETLKYISHSLSTLAVNTGIIIIQISQTSREYSRKQILDLYAGKGSGAIENASRKVLGITGKSDSKERKVEMFKNTDGETFETELEWTSSFRLVCANSPHKPEMERN